MLWKPWTSLFSCWLLLSFFSIPNIVELCSCLRLSLISWDCCNSLTSKFFYRVDELPLLVKVYMSFKYKRYSLSETCMLCSIICRNFCSRLTNKPSSISLSSMCSIKIEFGNTYPGSAKYFIARITDKVAVLLSNYHWRLNLPQNVGLAEHKHRVLGGKAVEIE